MTNLLADFDFSFETWNLNGGETPNSKFVTPVRYVPYRYDGTVSLKNKKIFHREIGWAIGAVPFQWIFLQPPKRYLKLWKKVFNKLLRFIGAVERIIPQNG